ncbi:MAG: 4-(cytidine 5'-diphospho)-2-C-methyl-D-erythritol kinase [Proteobacteria bacterium]|nr:4-(cytidine 5'-diphospho)-2-C-methyl-D-erythritol kinase [Pseudomonadota bacterium]
MTAAPADWSNEAAPAKVNLYLHVIDRRVDGYHRLDSLIVFAGIHDTIAVAPGEGLNLELGGPFASPLSDAQATAGMGENLMIRAARRLAEAAGVRPDAALRLYKRLPVAAGLGGGSADAAAVLRALARLWGVRPAASDLRALALELGADVPVCLRSEAAFVGGIGESLDAAPALPVAYLLLVNPGVRLSTSEVFAAREGAFSEPARFADPPARTRDLAALLEARANDLEPPARALAPEIGPCLRWLSKRPGCLLARMSGSGATCYGLFERAEEARLAARAIEEEGLAWWAGDGPLIRRLDELACRRWGLP